jgi:tetratricopeptide (TPR) repeat protein/tRNA A-37 threonylcarbamoyl transferase component Bud32
MRRPEQSETLVESLRRERIGAALFGEPSLTPTIGRFEILGTLGRGGMGEVLDARDPTLDRAVALKLLQRHAAGQQSRLLREAQALARLSHPNVVQVYEVGVVEGRLFIAMERLRGQTLHAWQASARPWTECLDAYLQAGAGLAAAHAEGLIHRDFKPNNCMIDEHGRVRVLDFGLARATTEGEVDVGELERSSADPSRSSSDSGDAAVTRPSLLAELLTRSGALLGTVAYMAPEQLLGVGVDARSDQFGFCVALFEAVHGHRPFAGRTGAELLLAIQRDAIEPGRAREGLPAVPRALDRVLRRGLARDPAARWPNMAALLESLAALRDRRRRRAWWGGGTLLVTTATLGVLAVLRDPPSRPCEGLRELEAPAWTAEQRSAVEQGLLEFGPRGAEVWQAVERTLDRYADEWVDARADACEAAHVQHSIGPRTLELRLACLDRRMQRMHALVEQLSILDRPGLAGAVEAAHSLPALDSCSDADALLRSEIVLPVAERARQLRVERLVDEGWAMQRAGRARDGAARAEAAIEQVAALEDERSIVAEARFLRGSLHFDARRSELARVDLQAAFRSAERSNHRALAREILTKLVRLEVWSRKPSAAEAWLIMAQALGPEANTTEQAELALAGGLVRLEFGDHAGAIEQLELAVALRRTHPGELELATALRLLGEARSSAGDQAGARTAYLESLELARANAALSMIAQTLHDIGVLERDLGRIAPARAAFEEALAVQIEVFGDRAPVSIHTRIGLADLALAEGDLVTALRQAEAAQAIAEGDPTLDPEDRGLLGMLLASLHRELDQPEHALGDYEWAREAFGAMPEVDHGAVAMADSGIADCLVALGRPDEARRHYEQALELLARHVEPSHPRWLYPQMGLGRLLLEQGEVEAARPLLERALALTGPGDEELAAMIRADIQRIP